jgi:hypothetical protein
MKPIATLALPALMLASCGPKTIALPSDPVERAATCSVVAAARARTGVGTGNLSVEQQGRIIHYPLLAGAEGAVFDQEKANAVVQMTPTIADRVTAAKWQELVAPCAQAYPATEIKAPQLPDRTIDAQLACYMLADFFGTALQQQDADYGDALSGYGAMRRGLDEKIGAALKGLGDDALKERRMTALSTAAKLGPSATVLKACVEKFD